MTSSRPRALRALRAVVATALVAALVAGCGARGEAGAGAAPDATAWTPSASSEATSYALPRPSPWRGRTVTPLLLVYAEDSLSPRVRKRIARVPGVGPVLAASVGHASVGGRTVQVLGADPARLRRFTAPTVATADDVWARVAGGEAAVAPALRPAIAESGNYLRLGTQPTAPAVYVGAVATLPPLLDVAVNHRWARALGLPPGNALLVAGRPGVEAEDIRPRVRRAAGGRVAIWWLTQSQHVAPTGPQTGYLTGGAVAEAVGSFTYLARPDGTIEVDPTWVAATIRTEEVPILGRVTCHGVMLPQLRGALAEVEARGLADRIRPDDYGGCFYPRFVGRDPAKGLSLHSWGIAVDLNVAGNQRGSAGEMDREVVAIFKRWGFAWGGDWAWTDPMHFELAALVRMG